MTAPDPIDRPAVPRRRWPKRLALALGAAAIVAIVVVTVLLVAFEQLVGPKPATERAMRELAAQAAEAFPEGEFDYQHRHHKANAIVLKAKIPVTLPLADHDAERIADLIAAHYAESLDGRWALELDIELVDGERTLAFEAVTTTADDLRFGGGLVELGFDRVALGRYAVEVDAACPHDDEACRAAVAERVLEAFDRFVAHRDAHPGLAASALHVEVEHVGLERAERGAASTTLRLRLPAAPDAGWRERAEAGLAVWVPAPIAFESPTGAAGQVLVGDVAISSDSDEVTVRIEAASPSRLRPDDWRDARAELIERVRAAHPATAFRFS